MQRNNVVRIEGQVEEALPGLLFRVKAKIFQTGEDKEILAHLGGKMKLNRIRVIPGDKVLVEMPNLNEKRGRIVRRL